MLSSVFSSERAIHVNIGIMRAYIKMCELANSHQDLKQKLDEMEGKYEKHDEQIQSIFEALRRLLDPPVNPNKRPIGFNA